MKHILLPIVALALMLISCNSDTPKPTKQVTFKLQGFEQTNSPLHIAPKANATILDDTDGKPLTDIYIFDGTTQLAHKTNDQEDFGTITLSLTHGNHDLSFIATRSTGLTYDQGILTATSVKPTFGALLSLNIDANTQAQAVTLNRISGQLTITIQDAFPSNANEIEFVINPRYQAINISNLCAVDGQSVTQRVSCADKAGKTEQSYTFTHLAPSTTDEYLAAVTINVYDTNGTLIHAVNISDVRLAANTKTILSGKVFTAPNATLNADHSWNTDIVGSF